tara:strand:- start:508 stop:852 length:345 start_codon:yes stop_codon:yes gene_type:complete
MIYNGSVGSINIFYKDLFISSFPIHNKIKTYENYKYHGEYLIEDTLKRNRINLKEQILTYKFFINNMYERKKRKESIWKRDHELLMCMVFALIKLKVLDEDDHILIMPKKKKLF